MRALLVIISMCAAVAAARPAAAEFVIGVYPSIEGYEETDARIASHQSELQCSQSLIETLPPPPIEGLRVQLNAPLAHLEIMVGYVNRVAESAAIQVASEPYLFRDAAHFLAFMRSDVLKRLRQIDQNAAPSVTWITVAYGGFNHLFSAARAMTEPKHFFERRISGASHAGFYQRLGADFISYASNHEDIRNEFDRFQQGSNDDRSRLPDGVVATTAQATSAKSLRRARFINLTSSAVYPVVFILAERQAERFKALSPDVRAWIENWIEIASVHCSKANFERERQFLATAAKQGHTVVPTNRKSFSEAAWIWSIESFANNKRSYSEAINWSVPDLDSIVKLQPGKLPSSVISKLSPALQTTVAARSKQVSARRAAQTAAMVARAEKQVLLAPIQRNWQHGASAIADHLRKNVDEIACRPGWPSPDARCQARASSSTGAPTACERNPITLAERGRPMVDGWYSAEKATREQIDGAVAKLATVKDGRTYTGIVANTLEDMSPGASYFVLEKVLTASPLLRQDLIPKFAAHYLANGKEGVTSGYKTTETTPWNDWDWLDDFRASALLSSWADDKGGLARLRDELSKADAKAATSRKVPMAQLAENVRRARLKLLYSLIDTAIKGDAAALDRNCGP